MSEISFAVGTIGLVIPFCLINPLLPDASSSIPISNALAANTVVWVAHNGKRRPLTLSQPVSATFTYVVSADDSRMPHVEEGRVEITFGSPPGVVNRFYTSAFGVNVYQHF